MGDWARRGGGGGAGVAQGLGRAGGLLETGDEVAQLTNQRGFAERGIELCLHGIYASREGAECRGGCGEVGTEGNTR